jgi:hypothetical protein
MSYDVQLTDDHDIPARTTHISGVEFTRQRLLVKLRTFAGEWFLDTRRGLPWFAWKQQKPLDQTAVRSRVRQAIRTTPGVIDVTSLQTSLSGGTFTLSARVLVEDQELALSMESPISGGNAQPVTITVL